MMRHQVARVLTLAVPVCFFGSFVLIYVNPSAILPALGMLIASLVLVPLCVIVRVTGRYRPLPDLGYTQPTGSTRPTDGREYRTHAAAQELDCDGCGITIDRGDDFYVLWEYDDILGHWSDADAPRLCAHCASLSEYGIEAYA